MHTHTSQCRSAPPPAVSAFTSQQLRHFSELVFQPKSNNDCRLVFAFTFLRGKKKPKIEADQRCVVVPKKSTCGSPLKPPGLGFGMAVVAAESPRGEGLPPPLSSSPSSEPLAATSLWSWAARGLLADDQKLHNRTRKPAGRLSLSSPHAAPPFAFYHLSFSSLHHFLPLRKKKHLFFFACR